MLVKAETTELMRASIDLLNKSVDAPYYVLWTILAFLI